MLSRTRCVEFYRVSDLDDVVHVHLIAGAGQLNGPVMPLPSDGRWPVFLGGGDR